MRKTTKILILLAFIAVGCGGNTSKKQNDKGNLESDIVQISDSLQNYLNNFRKIDLPIVIDKCEPETENLHYFKDKVCYAYGRFATNGNYIAIMLLGVGDCLFPVLTTYNYNGEEIDKKTLALGCSADCGWICEEFMTIKENFSICVADTITAYDCDSIGIITETYRHYVRYQAGKLLPNGMIELGEMEEKDLPTENNDK